MSRNLGSLSALARSTLLPPFQVRFFFARRLGSIFPCGCGMPLPLRAEARVFFLERSRGRAAFKIADFGSKRRMLPPGAAEQLGRPVCCAGAAACTHIARTAVESPMIKNTQSNSDQN